VQALYDTDIDLLEWKTLAGDARLEKVTKERPPFPPRKNQPDAGRKKGQS
jgi:hypothetical protein